MAKPICVIKIDMEADFGNGQSPKLYELNEVFEKRLPDYHVFVVPQNYDRTEPKEPIQFQVFHEKDFTEIQYAELKQLITDSISQTKSFYTPGSVDI